MEAAAEADEEFMEKYLVEGYLTNEEIKKGIRAQTIANRAVPAFCGSAFKNKGVQAMLDAVVEYLPAPTDVQAIKGLLEDEVTEAQRPATEGAYLLDKNRHRALVPWTSASHGNSIGSHPTALLFGGEPATIHSNSCPINSRW